VFGRAVLDELRAFDQWCRNYSNKGFSGITPVVREQPI
jgi:hypothetical protein